jgi:NAD(P)-dependent dehydrogenase (short-subunit alcohol dehydrogenase family)
MGQRLQGKVAVVMGAGSSAPGFSNGKACAMAYAREGASVVAVDFDFGRAEETAKIISDEGLTARAFRADVTRAADVEAAMAFAVEQFGGLDVAHNNVGTGSNTSSKLDGLTMGDWDREIAVTLTSAFLGMKAAIPHLRARGGGAIVNTSSISAVRALKRSNNAAYTAAKAGVEAMTRLAASEYGPENIRVNCIRIGFADTPLVRRLFQGAGIEGEALEAKMKETGLGVPLRGERTSVWDVANAAVFLASDEARHVTGVILSVDGGLDVAQI